MPSSPFGRVMGFAQLGASLVYGTMSDSVSQYFGPKPAATDPQKPANRCASTSQKGVCRCSCFCTSMRGMHGNLVPLVGTIHY